MEPLPVDDLNPDEPGHTIFRVSFDGYNKGKPSQIEMRFFHENQELQDAWIHHLEPPEPGERIHGSKIIAEYFNARDPRLTKYLSLRPKHRLNDCTLDQAVSSARAYIEACCDPEISILFLCVEQSVVVSISRPLHQGPASSGFQGSNRSLNLCLRAALVRIERSFFSMPFKALLNYGMRDRKNLLHHVLKSREGFCALDHFPFGIHCF